MLRTDPCSWLACRDDLVSLFVEAITNTRFKGSFNATAPNPVTMGELCNTLGNCLGRPSWLPVPAFALTVSPGFQHAASANTAACASWGCLLKTLLLWLAPLRLPLPSLTACILAKCTRHPGCS